MKAISCPAERPNVAIRRKSEEPIIDIDCKASKHMPTIVNTVHHTWLNKAATENTKRQTGFMLS
jgi:hypothetical protein